MLVVSCSSGTVAQSDEAQMAQFFISLEKINKEDERAVSEQTEELKTGMLEAMDGKGAETLEVALSKIRPIQANYQTKLIALTPPERLRKFHKELMQVTAESMALFESLLIAARTKDEAKVKVEIQKFGQIAETTEAKVTSAMREAGFSSKEELYRALNRGVKTPIAWYWALTILAFVAAILAGFLQFIGALCLLPAMGFFMGGANLMARGKFAGGIFSFAVALVILAFVCSMIGVALTGIGEELMFPRTELSSWFIYPVGAFLALGVYSSKESGGENDKSGAWGCVPPLFCLSGYLWAALAQGTLFGPWSWVITMVKNILP